MLINANGFLNFDSLEFEESDDFDEFDSSDAFDEQGNGIEVALDRADEEHGSAEDTNSDSDEVQEVY